MDISGIYKNLISITLFNKGKASKLFSRVNNGETLLVIKNNTPVAVVLSPQEYEILRSFPKTYIKLKKNGEIISTADIDELLSKLELFDKNGDLYV